MSEITSNDIRVSLRRRRITKVLPWIVTVVALYIAFHDVDWQELIAHLKDASFAPLLLVVILTVFSYLMRSRRWQYLFPESAIPYVAALKVLILGFFMNNVLPARAGELVRAHMGSRVTGSTRTLVLATIFSERLADGLMLSAFFVLFALGVGSESLSGNLLIVALLFALAACGVALVLILRNKLIALAENLSNKLNHRASTYTFDRLRIFLDGLSPLLSVSRFPVLCLWTVAIWSIELAAFVSVSVAFDAGLTLGQCVLFMVTVNFSSLIPAAPGGIGVIEAIASAVLISLGLPKEQALTMVLVQHVVQYAVVGVPGAIITLTWKHALSEPEANQTEVVVS